MERKLIKQGGGGYTIYLPKKWVRTRGLEAGNRVGLTETGNTLLISSASKGRKEITIPVTDENAHDLQNLLTHLYRRGFDRITFTEASERQMTEIRRATQKLLLGFEMISTTPCIVESVSEPAERQYDALLRRVFLLIKESHALILEDCTAGDYGRMALLQDYRDQLDKYILFCRRILLREQHARQGMLDWELLTFLLHIQHGLYYLYKHALGKKLKMNKSTIELLTYFGEYYGLFYKAFYEKDLSHIHRITRRGKTYIYGDCYDALARAKGEEAVTLAHIRELFRLVQVGTSPILASLLEERIPDRT